VTRLEIVGPRGLAELLERAASIFGKRSWLRFDAVDIREVDPSDRAADIVRGPLRLSWAATGHTPESVAWRVDLEGVLEDAVSVCYSGDSGVVASWAALAREVDLFVCECSFPDEAAVEHHLTPSSAGRLAQASGCRKLVLTHFYPVLDPEAARAGASRYFRGPIELSRDGSQHAIGRAE
jgi:ribonuclease BN (tRNA processing enzyme)